MDVQSYKNSTVDAINNKKNGGKKWIVLVAGSRGWSNYRHQVWRGNIKFKFILFVNHEYYCDVYNNYFASRKI